MQAQLARLAAVKPAALPDGGERLCRRRADLHCRIAELSREPLGSNHAPASSGGGLGGGSAQSAGADSGSRPPGSAPPAEGPAAPWAGAPSREAQPASCQPSAAGRADSRHGHAGPDLSQGLAERAAPPQAGLVPVNVQSHALGQGGKSAASRPHAEGAAPDSFLMALRTPLPGSAPAAQPDGSCASSYTGGRLPEQLRAQPGRTCADSGVSSSMAEPLHSTSPPSAPACAGLPQRAAPAAQAEAGGAPAPPAVTRNSAAGVAESAQQHAVPGASPAAPTPLAAGQAEPATPLMFDAGGRACAQSGRPATGLSQKQQGGAMRLSARVRAMKAQLQALLAVLGDPARLAALPDGGCQVRWPWSPSTRMSTLAASGVQCASRCVQAGCGGM